MKTKEQLDADTLFAFQMAMKGHKQFEFLSLAGDWRKTDSVSSEFSHRIYHDIPEAWTRHDGEDWKGDNDAVIEGLIFCDGQTDSEKGFKKGYTAEWFRSAGNVNSFTDTHPYRRIYAYKLSEKPEKKVIPWTLETCPTLPFEVVDKDSGSGYTVVERHAEGYRKNNDQNQKPWPWYVLLENYKLRNGSPCGTEVEQ